MKNILIAEDDEDDYSFFTEIINQVAPAGVSITRITNGEEVLETLQAHPKEYFSFLLLDINLPRKNGFQCLKEIRSNEELKDLPVIIITTTSDSYAISQSYQSKADLFVVKPQSTESWYRIIQKILAIDWPRSDRTTPIEHFVLTA